MILIVGLTLINFGWGRVLARTAKAKRRVGPPMALGVVLDLGVLSSAAIRQLLYE